MRILFLLTQDLDSPSGLGRYWPLARELSKRGHQVRIATLHSDFGTLSVQQQKRDDVEVHYVAPMHVMKSGDQKSYYTNLKLIGVALRATLALSWAALKTPTDIVYVGKPHPMNSCAGLLLKVLRRIPMLVDCDDYEAGSGRFSDKWQRKTVEFFEKRVPRLAETVTTHTHFMRANLVSWGVLPEKIIYLPNGVDPDRFVSPNPLRLEKKRKKLNLTDKKVVAYIGSLSMPSHPVNLLIEAFAQIQHDIPEAVLLIVGGGEEMANLQKLVIELGIEEITCFVGRVPPEDIPLYYALADVSIDPVHDDSAARGRSPLKLFESWICGVPFVSADVGERANLMGDPPAGVLVPPNQTDELSKGILDILINPESAAKYIRRGQRRVQKYHWQILAQKLENVFLNQIP